MLDFGKPTILKVHIRNEDLTPESYHGTLNIYVEIQYMKTDFFRLFHIAERQDKQNLYMTG